MDTHERLRNNRRMRIAPAKTLHDLCRLGIGPPDKAWSTQQVYSRVLKILAESPKNAQMIAGDIGVSKTQAFIYINALRRQGHDIQSIEYEGVTLFKYFPPK